MLATLIFALAAFITSLTGLLTIFLVRKDVSNVHTEVKTLNGKSVGVLLDNQEGRRIIADVPVSEQTSADKHYVEALEKRDRENT